MKFNDDNKQGCFVRVIYTENMRNQKQVNIERTLLIGLAIGLLIGFFSKRIAYGLLLGIAVAFLISYLMKPKTEDQS